MGVVSLLAPGKQKRSAASRARVYVACEPVAAEPEAEDDDADAFDDAFDDSFDDTLDAEALGEARMRGFALHDAGDAFSPGAQVMSVAPPLIRLH